MKKPKNIVTILVALFACFALTGAILWMLHANNTSKNTRNAERQADVNTILNAVYQYSIDFNGQLPSGIDATSTSSQVLGTATTGCDATCTAATTVASCLDLSGDIVPDFLVGIPTDPTTGTDANTDYYINQDANGRLVVGACDAEQSETIEITR